MTETVSDKAHRFYTEGRCEDLGEQEGIRRYEVRGDSASYLVRWHPEGWTCTCPAMSEFGAARCSHTLAAMLCWSAAHRAGNVVNLDEED